MSLTEAFVPACAQTLRAMNGWLDKAVNHAAAGGDDAEALLSLRLAPDMYPLAAQLRFPCFMAQEPIYRLSGRPVPESLEEVRREGWNAGERPGTIADARRHLADALDSLDGVSPDQFNGAPDRAITLDLPNGMIFDLTGDQYVRDWVLPNFHFHVGMAYAILRRHGVPLGKADLLPHMFAYLRPGTAPAA